MNKTASRKSRFLSPGWLMFFSALLCVALVPVVQAAMRYSSERSERYRELTEMTESERLKIQHSFAEFQKLSPAEQESYRELDRRLNEDDLRLKDTLASYQEFLSTLSPVDRAEVDRAASTRERLNVIERIQKERAELRQQLEAGYTLIEERYRTGEFRDRWPVLSAAEMEAITQSIENRLPDPAAQKFKLESKTGTVRFAWAVIAALDVWKPVSPPGPGRSNLELFPEELREEIVSEIQNEKIREDFDRVRYEKERTFTRTFLWLARRTVFREHVKNTPDISKLSEHLNTLDAEKKAEWLAKDPKRFYGDLVREYFDKKPNDVSKALDELWEKTEPYLRGGWPGGRGGQGVRGPRRPDGRGDDDQDPDDDNNRGRFDRNRERPENDGEGAFNEGRRGRGFREGGSGERFGDRGRTEPESTFGSD